VAVAMNHAKFDCNNCPWGRHCDSDYQWPGSVGPFDYDKWEVKGVGYFRTCLLPMVTRKSSEMIRAHTHYEKGFLPRAGGILDQPALFGEAMRVIDLARPQFMDNGRG
jgi:hypothetical protein